MARGLLALLAAARATAPPAAAALAGRLGSKAFFSAGHAVAGGEEGAGWRQRSSSRGRGRGHRNGRRGGGGSHWRRPPPAALPARERVGLGRVLRSHWKKEEEEGGGGRRAREKGASQVGARVMSEARGRYERGGGGDGGGGRAQEERRRGRGRKRRETEIPIRWPFLRPGPRRGPLHPIPIPSSARASQSMTRGWRDGRRESREQRLPK